VLISCTGAREAIYNYVCRICSGDSKIVGNRRQSRTAGDRLRSRPYSLCKSLPLRSHCLSSKIETLALLQRHMASRCLARKLGSKFLIEQPSPASMFYFEGAYLPS
jgi:hypothetical protein